MSSSIDCLYLNLCDFKKKTKMKRKHIHTRTISKLPPEAFIEEFINDTHKIHDNVEKYKSENNITKQKKKKKKSDTARVVLLGIENVGKTSIFNQLRFVLIQSQPIHTYQYIHIFSGFSVDHIQSLILNWLNAKYYASNI